jgi:hypothetical protein
MSDSEIIAQAMNLEDEAARTFGADSMHIRMILGFAIGWLSNRAGLPATIAYVQKSLRICSCVDGTEPPANPPPS